MPTLATLPPSPLTLCLLGTGNMGLPMARRLAQAGYPVRVWNRTQAKAEVLAADGAVICATPRQACSGADITLSLLENGDVVEQVLFGLGADSACHGLASGSLYRLDPGLPVDASVDALEVGRIYLGANANRIQAGELLLFVGKNGANLLHLVLRAREVEEEKTLERVRIDLDPLPDPVAPAAPRERGEFGPSVWFLLSVGHSGRAEARWLLPSPSKKNAREVTCAGEGTEAEVRACASLFSSWRCGCRKKVSVMVW